MAYTRRRQDAYPGPVTPGVLSIYLPNSASAIDIIVKVPWDYCQLVYAHTVVLTEIDATGAMEIDLEIDAAGGTEIGSISIATESAVGTEDEDEITHASARHLTSSNKINVEVDGSAAAAGAAMLFLYFEADQS